MKIQELTTEVENLKKQLRKQQQLVAKYEKERQDYQTLLKSFKHSEQIRARQKHLIDTLKNSSRHHKS
jgi:hypothetical protein